MFFDNLILRKSGIIIEGLENGMTKDEVLSAKNLNDDEYAYYDLQTTQPEFMLMTKQENSFCFEETGSGSAIKMYQFSQDGLCSVTYAVNYQDIPFDESYEIVKSVYNSICGALDGIESIEDGTLDELHVPGNTFQRKWAVGEKHLIFSTSYQDMSNAEYETDHVLWLNVIVNL